MSKSKGFTLVELLLVFMIMSILVSIGVTTYNKTVVTANAKSAGKILQTLFARQMLYADENYGVTLNCYGATDCASKMKIEISTAFSGTICYTNACAGGCAQMTGVSIGGSYFISNNASPAVQSGTCPCACP